mmetsp:Transcript_68952/g.154423  ORF Transcript_68952/g.154423 Transcript_68952/m.154423 type:complete len:156 (-) Transcript_68952:4-471(-)
MQYQMQQPMQHAMQNQYGMGRQSQYSAQPSQPMMRGQGMNMRQGGMGNGSTMMQHQPQQHGGGSRPHNANRLAQELERMLDRWVEAKRAKDFALADDIRSKLRAQGVEPDTARPAHPGGGSQQGFGGHGSQGGMLEGPMSKRPRVTNQSQDTYLK